MFSEVIYFILGFILGGIVTILRAGAREAHYEACTESLEGQNKMLRDKVFPDEDPGDDAIGVGKCDCS